MAEFADGNPRGKPNFRQLYEMPKVAVDDAFLAGPTTAEAVQAASIAFKNTLIERALGAEQGYYLGYPAGAERPPEATNQRNGKTGKPVLTDDGPLRLQIPRGRDTSFAPILTPKHPSRFTGFEDKNIGDVRTRYHGALDTRPP